MLPPNSTAIINAHKTWLNLSHNDKSSKQEIKTQLNNLLKYYNQNSSVVENLTSFLSQVLSLIQKYDWLKPLFPPAISELTQEKIPSLDYKNKISLARDCYESIKSIILTKLNAKTSETPRYDYFEVSTNPEETNIVQTKDLLQKYNMSNHLRSRLNLYKNTSFSYITVKLLKHMDLFMGCITYLELPPDVESPELRGLRNIIIENLSKNTTEQLGNTTITPPVIETRLNMRSLSNNSPYLIVRLPGDIPTLPTKPSHVLLHIQPNRALLSKVVTIYSIKPNEARNQGTIYPCILLVFILLAHTLLTYTFEGGINSQFLTPEKIEALLAAIILPLIFNKPLQRPFIPIQQLEGLFIDFKSEQQSAKSKEALITIFFNLYSSSPKLIEGAPELWVEIIPQIKADLNCLTTLLLGYGGASIESNVDTFIGKIFDKTTGILNHTRQNFPSSNHGCFFIIQCFHHLYGEFFQHKKLAIPHRIINNILEALLNQLANPNNQHNKKLLGEMVIDFANTIVSTYQIELDLEGKQHIKRLSEHFWSVPIENSECNDNLENLIQLINTPLKKYAGNHTLIEILTKMSKSTHLKISNIVDEADPTVSESIYTSIAPLSAICYPQQIFSLIKIVCNNCQDLLLKNNIGEGTPIILAHWLDICNLIKLIISYKEILPGVRKELAGKWLTKINELLKDQIHQRASVDVLVVAIKTLQIFDNLIIPPEEMGEDLESQSELIKHNKNIHECKGELIETLMATKFIAVIDSICKKINTHVD
ncbi:MAG: hypothetical protein KBD37_09170, partial [Burkholderiales bacterium]|nr:hypothetical protein [Burkholderiales bacterium]